MSDMKDKQNWLTVYRIFTACSTGACALLFGLILYAGEAKVKDIVRDETKIFVSQSSLNEKKEVNDNTIKDLSATVKQLSMEVQKLSVQVAVLSAVVQKQQELE